MRKTKTGMSVVACLAATVAVAPTAFAQATIIYDNSSQYFGFSTGQRNEEIGDIVTFAAGTTDRLLHEFQFEYFAGAVNPQNNNAAIALSGNETAQVFLRNVIDGITPGEVIFQTEPFSLISGFKTAVVGGLNTALPDTIAWTVKFSGFENTESRVETGSLLFYNGGTGTVGTNPLFEGSDFMIMNNNDGTFAILNTQGVVDNLGARFTAIPEPSTWALILTGIAGFGLLRRRNS